MNFLIPHQSRYLTPVNLFTATFNVPTLGVYDFGIAANRFQNVIQLDLNTIYLVSALSIGGTIDETIYSNAINTVPAVRLFYGLGSSPAYAFSIPLVQYFDDREFLAWVKSDKQGDTLQMSLDVGILNQTADLVGIPSITLNVTLSIYAISDQQYNIAWRDELSPEFSQRIRR